MNKRKQTEGQTIPGSIGIIKDACISSRPGCVRSHQIYLFTISCAGYRNEIVVYVVKNAKLFFSYYLLSRVCVNLKRINTISVVDMS